VRTTDEISFTDTPFPEVIGGSWSDGVEAFKHLSGSAESKTLPGIESVAGRVSLPSKLGKIEAVQIETRDGSHIAHIMIRFSDNTGCKAFGAAVRKAASWKWADWKTNVVGKEVETRARLPGEELLSARCGRAGVFLRLDDAWTALPTDFRGMGGNTAGELVWNLVTNHIAAAQAMNSHLTKRDVSNVTDELRELLVNLSDVNMLSPRSREAFETFRALACSEEWITRQFKLGLTQQ
jgi:hypothetical protein